MGQPALKIVDNEINLDDILSGAEKEKKTAKSKVPEIELPLEQRLKVDKIRTLKAEIDNNETELELLFNDVLKSAEQERNKMLSNNGYFSSVKVYGTNGESIIISWKDKYNKIPLQNYNELKELLSSNTDNYFEKKMTIKVKEEIAEQDLKELILLIGADKFSKFFEVERWIEPTSKYTFEKHLFDEKIREKLDLIVKQYKPALKTKWGEKNGEVSLF